MKPNDFTRRMLSGLLALLLVPTVALNASRPVDAMYDENETEMGYFEDYLDENETPEDIFTAPEEEQWYPLDENELPPDIFPDTEASGGHYDENETEMDHFDQPEDSEDTTTPKEPGLLGNGQVTLVHPVLTTRPIYRLPPYGDDDYCDPPLPSYSPSTEIRTDGDIQGPVSIPRDNRFTVELWMIDSPYDNCYMTNDTQGDSFSFSGIHPTDYIVKLLSDHCVPREYMVTVTNERLEIQETLRLNFIGDVNSDDEVTIADVARLYSHTRGTRPLTDDYILACAEVAGDDTINTADVARLYAHVVGTKPIW